MHIGIIEMKRDHRLDHPMKIVRFVEFRTFPEAFSYLAKFPDNQIICPSVKAANHVVDKWKAEQYEFTERSCFDVVNGRVVSSWISQVFLCTFTDNLRVIHTYNRSMVLEYLQAYRKKGKSLKSYSYVRRHYMPESEHHIPYKKKSFYEAGYHSPKNGKLRAMDIPKEYFTYPVGEEIDETYYVKLPRREFMDWDSHSSHKYWSRNGHICWKNYKKNRKQWMKHKPSWGKDPYPLESILDPWEGYEEDIA